MSAHYLLNMSQNDFIGACDTMSESGFDFSKDMTMVATCLENTMVHRVLFYRNMYNLCIFSPCGCHSLNLVGQDSAAIYTDAVTFFGIVETIYNFFPAALNVGKC